MNPDDHWLAVVKTSAIHGTGDFARVKWQKGQRIIGYIGPCLALADLQAELDAGNVYTFIPDEDGAIDGGVLWRPARFLKPSCGLNSESRIECRRVWS